MGSTWPDNLPRVVEYYCQDNGQKGFAQKELNARTLTEVKLQMWLLARSLKVVEVLLPFFSPGQRGTGICCVQVPDGDAVAQTDSEFATTSCVAVGERAWKEANCL